MTKLLFIASAFAVGLNQPSTLQLIEEQVESVIMVHCVAYEKGENANGAFADVSIVYTGNNTIDAKKDSTYYYVYGNYSFEKYTNVNNQVFGNIPGQSFNKSGSQSYVAKVKQVLDDYRVQEILIVDKPSDFEFGASVFDSLKLRSDMIYPELVFRDKKEKKE